ncbi:MAG: phage integrase SAM-like domain-containing protein [Parabacteroides sp.]|nr:phage integrase SAM-like domain-containing protein [Parabacteroides sp.]
MATIKVKFRSSTVRGKAGVIYYQLCNKQENRQMITDMRIFPHWWNGERRELVVTPENEKIINSYQKRIKTDLATVRRIIRELDSIGDEYTLSDVIGRFRSPKKGKGVLDYLRGEIEFLRENNKFSTSRNYLRTLNSFSSFLDNCDIPLSALDEEVTCQYEKWLSGRGVSKNSSSFYMRNLRAAYNKAVQEQLVEQAFPFLEVYTGIAKTPKRAVSETTILKLQELDLSDSLALALSRDLFLFSYCTRGMAFVDMAYLKKENIGTGVITYCRHKTAQSLTLRIEPCIEEILRRYLSDSSETPYVFPIITDENPDRAYLQYQTGLNYHNQKLKRLGKLIGETLPLSSYTSRHSWATAARNHNIPIAVISAGMGHTSEKTTLIYLDSLDNSLIDNANSGILKDLNSTVSW